MMEQQHYLILAFDMIYGGKSKRKETTRKIKIKAMDSSQLWQRRSLYLTIEQKPT
jgi:hypothetical protein